MNVSVFRRAHFNAAHRLHVPGWSEEQNRTFFGLCNLPNYHGHNYEVEVMVKGVVDPVSGYVMDMKVLKDLMDEEFIEPWDHRNLNLDTEEFKNLNPTAENIAVVIWNKLRKRIDMRFNLCIRLYETPRNYVEYDGQ
ncbi:MAG: 6-carboxytetrahydropterin synthase [Bacteroidetes bacterium]|nr:6-carboxytetrahydropterin synthase [Bacteroidota bacterium]